MNGKKPFAPQVIQGMTLGTLFSVLARNGFQVDTGCLGRLGYLVLLGIFNSVFRCCEEFFNAEEIAGTELPTAPLFVLGHWRSGTTHLHNLLNCDERFACPTAYQALFPHHFVFSQVGGVIFDRLAPPKRPMDNVAFSSIVPHEDEFGLAASCGISPYMRFLFPVTGNNGYCEFDATALSPEALDEWKRAFLLFLKKLTLSEGRRIVLKSPPHLGRIPVLLEMFPDARFVHIVRNPYAVYASTHKLWKDSLAYAHLQIPSPDLVDGIILSSYERLFELFERDRHLIPPGALHEMRFEDLEERPLETLLEMYERLGLGPFEEFGERVTRYLGTVKGYVKNCHSLDPAKKAEVAGRWEAAFERYGYTR